MSLKKWAEYLDVSLSTLRKRIHRGLPPDEVFSTDRRITVNGKYKSGYFWRLEQEEQRRRLDEMEVFKYGMRLRGFSPGAQPMVGFLRREDDPTGRYFDVLVYDRLLQQEELSEYSLDLIKAVKDD